MIWPSPNDAEFQHYVYGVALKEYTSLDRLALLKCHLATSEKASRWIRPWSELLRLLASILSDSSNRSLRGIMSRTTDHPSRIAHNTTASLNNLPTESQSGRRSRLRPLPRPSLPATPSHHHAAAVITEVNTIIAHRFGDRTSRSVCADRRLGRRQRAPVLIVTVLRHPV